MRLPKLIFLIFTISILTIPYLGNITADPDLWWHAKVGMENLKEKNIATTDVYSFTTEKARWINHEWLSEIIIASFFSWRGEEGLFMLRTFLFCGTITALALLFWLKWPSPLPVLSGTILILPFLSLFLNTRPASFTFFLTALFLLLLEVYQRGVRFVVWFLPFLMAIWTNLHGGFLIGLGLAAVGLSQKPIPHEKRQLLSVLFLTLISPMFNPYGWRLFSYIVKELSSPHYGIAEWAPISSQQLPFYLFFLILPGLMVGVSKSWRQSTPTIFYAITAIGSYFSARFIIFFVIFSVLVMLESGKILWAKVENNPRIKEGLRPYQSFIVPFFCMYLIIPSSIQIVTNPEDFKMHVKVDTAHTPIAAAQFLKSHDLGTNIINPFDWGGYLVWHLCPRYKIAVDGRNVTLYKPSYFNEYVKAWHGGDIDKLTQNARVDLVLVANGEVLDKTLKNNHAWREIYRDSVAAIYLSENKPFQSLSPLFRSGDKGSGIAVYFPG